VDGPVNALRYLDALAAELAGKGWTVAPCSDVRAAGAALGQTLRTNVPGACSCWWEACGTMVARKRRTCDA
jgi:hypothetical protein